MTFTLHMRWPRRRDAEEARRRLDESLADRPAVEQMTRELREIRRRNQFGPAIRAAMRHR